MLNDIIKAPRTDAIYNMHGYLTKIPVGAIIPFIEENCPSQGIVADMFAGSGMTAIAARMANRNAIVSDISVLGKHICEGYLTPVDKDAFVTTANELVALSKANAGRLYKTIRRSDGTEVELIRTVWSFVFSCVYCNGDINYYNVLKAANWESGKMHCPHCNTPFIKKKAEYIDETPVFVVVKGKDGKQTEQPLCETDYDSINKARQTDILDTIPSNEIHPHREMYRRSALEKWDLTETKRFFSPRNAAVLFDLWNRIHDIDDENIRKKMLFAFTAILPRASKRYQWSHKAPLNAANQNYYIAPVFFEWNVYDLFLRKINAVLKSDAMIFNDVSIDTTQEYITCSAHNLGHIEDASIDYVFTDPPFGSNIFYADMNLFQEAWLGDTTNEQDEAVIRTSGGKQNKEAHARRYYEILVQAFSEAHRILKPGGKLSIVFGNSKGEIWSIAQQAIRDAGFTGTPDSIKILDKGQRSVKGLNSGTEKVCTLDLIVTISKRNTDETVELESVDTISLIHQTIEKMILTEDLSVSHVYMEVLRNGIAQNINIADIDMHDVLEELNRRGIKVIPETGKLWWNREAA